jgi:ketosteroid isomerase-like protein
MTPLAPDRDRLLTAFSRALFRNDLDALYAVVAPDFVWRLPIGPDAPHARALASRAELAAYFAEREARYSRLRFEDVAYHHAPDATFMTFRAIGEYRDGAAFSVDGMERYLFRDGLIAMKDAYWKRIGQE